MFQLAQESDIDFLRPGYIPFGEPWHRENNKCAYWPISVTVFTGTYRNTGTN